MELDRLFYTLGIKMEGFDTAIRKAETQFGGLVQVATKAAATIALAFGFKEVISQINTIGDAFETNMAQVKGITTLTDEEFKKLQESLLDLSTDASKGSHSVLSMSKALYQTISAGIDAGDSIEFLGKAMQAATGGGADLKVVVDGLTNIMNGWGYSMNDLDAIIDKVFYAIKAGKTTFTELAGEIGNVASTADNAGISLDEILSGVVILTKKGIETNRAITYMNAAISEIISPTDQATKAAEQFGIEFNLATLASKGFVGLLTEIEEKTGGSADAISALFSSREAQKGVSAIMGGDSLKEFETLIGNMSGDLTELKGKLTETWQVNIFENVDDASGPAAKSIGNVKTASEEAWAAFKSFYDDSKRYAAESDLDTATFVSAIDNIDDAAERAGTSFGKISASLWAVALTTGLPVRMIINAILGIDEGIDGVTLQKIDDELKQAGENGNAAKEEIITAFTDLQNNKAINFDNIIAAMTGVITKAGETIEPITKVIDELDKLNGKDVDVDFDAVQRKVETLSSAIDTPVGEILDAITQLSDLGTENGMDFSTTWNAIMDLEQRSGESLKKIREGLIKLDEDPGNTDFMWAHDALSATAAKFGHSVFDMKNLIMSIDDEQNFDFGSIVGKLTQLSKPLTEAVGYLGGIIQELGGDVDFAGLVTALGNLPQDATFQGNVEKIKTAIEAVNSAGTGLTFPKVAEAINNMIEGTDKSVNDVIMAVARADEMPPGFNYEWLRESLEEEAKKMGTTVTALRKAIATLDDDKLDFSSVVELFSGKDATLQEHLDAIAANADTIVQTSKDYGLSVADIIRQVDELAAGSEGATGSANKALDDMLNTIEQKEAAIKNKMDKLALDLNENMSNLKLQMLKTKEHVVDWALQVSAGELWTIVGALGAMAAPAILGGIGKLLTLIKGLSAGFGGWAGVLQLVGFAVAGVTTVISMLNVETATTNDEIERMDEALEALGNISFEDVVRRSEETDANLKSMIQHTKDLMDGADDLAVAVEAYNKAYAEGGTEAALLKETIKGILGTHEELQSVLVETNSGYDIQYEKLSKIYQLEMARIRASQAERLASIQDEKKTINEYETHEKEHEALIARAGDLKVVSAALRSFKQEIETVEGGDAGMRALREKINEGLRELQEEFGNNLPEFSEVLEQYFSVEESVDLINWRDAFKNMETSDIFSGFLKEADKTIEKFDQMSNKLDSMYAGYEVAKSNTDYDSLSVVTSFEEIAKLEKQMLVAQIKAINDLEPDQEKRTAEIERVVNQYNANLNKNSVSALKLLPTTYKDQLNAILKELAITAEEATKEAEEYITTATLEAEEQRLQTLRDKVIKDLAEQQRKITAATNNLDFILGSDADIELKANAYAGLASEIDNIKESLFGIEMAGGDLGEEDLNTLLDPVYQIAGDLEKLSAETGRKLSDEVLGTLNAIMAQANAVEISGLTDSDDLKASYYELYDLYKVLNELARQSFVMDLQNEGLNTKIDESKKKIEGLMQDLKDALRNTEAGEVFGEPEKVATDYVALYTQGFEKELQERLGNWSIDFDAMMKSPMEEFVDFLKNMFSPSAMDVTDSEGFSAMATDFAERYVAEFGKAVSDIDRVMAAGAVEMSGPKEIHEQLNDNLSGLTFEALDELKDNWQRFITIGTDESESFGVRAETMETLAMKVSQVAAALKTSTDHYDPKKAYQYETMGEVLTQYQGYLEQLKEAERLSQELNAIPTGTQEYIDKLEALKTAQQNAAESSKQMLNAMNDMTLSKTFDLSGLTLNPEALQAQVDVIDDKLASSMAQIDVAQLNSEWQRIQKNIFDMSGDEMLSELESLQDKYQSLFAEWEMNGVFEKNPELQTKMLSDIGILAQNISALGVEVQKLKDAEDTARMTQGIKENIQSLEKQIEFINTTGLNAESLETKIRQLAAAYLNLAIVGTDAADSMNPEELQQAKDAYNAIAQVIESFDMRVPLPDNIDELIVQYPFLEKIVTSIKERKEETVAAIEKEIGNEERILELYREMDGEGELYTKTLRKIITLYKEWIEAAYLSEIVSIEQIDAIKAKLQGLEGVLEGLNDNTQPDTFWSDFQNNLSGEQKLLDYFKETGDMDRYKSQLSSVISMLQQKQEEVIKTYGTESQMLNVINQQLQEYEGENQTILDQEKQRTEEMEHQKEQLEAQAKFMNAIVSSIASELKQFGSLGSLIGGILDQLKFTVEEMEDGSYSLVSPFENMEQLTANIGASIAAWAISEIGKQIQGILASLEKIDELAALDKWDMGATKLAETLKNFKEFEQNQAILQDLKGQRIGAGILDFLTFGFLGLGEKIDDQIADIEEKLKATASAVASALGVGVEDLSSSLENAFMNSDTYESFVSNFSESLETMTKQALIRAFISSEVVQGAFKGLSELFVKLYEDGDFSAADINKLKDATGNIKDQLAPWWDAIQEILGDFGGGDEWSESSAVKDTIREDTANRLAALLSTINLNVANINDILSHKSIAVRVINIEDIGGISASDYLRAIGG